MLITESKRQELVLQIKNATENIKELRTFLDENRSILEESQMPNVIIDTVIPFYDQFVRDYEALTLELESKEDIPIIAETELLEAIFSKDSPVVFFMPSIAAIVSNVQEMDYEKGDQFHKLMANHCKSMKSLQTSVLQSLGELMACVSGS